MENQKFKIVSTQSNIDWVGRKITGSHNGTIAVKEGELILNNDKLTGGKIIVNVASIKILDVTDPATNAQFAGHLASDDFFSTEKYPEAMLDITSVSGNHVEGNLTIKGITKEVELEAEYGGTEKDSWGNIKVGFEVTGTIDRKEFNVSFNALTETGGLALGEKIKLVANIQLIKEA